MMTPKTDILQTLYSCKNMDISCVSDFLEIFEVTGVTTRRMLIDGLPHGGIQFTMMGKLRFFNEYIDVRCSLLILLTIEV